MLWLKYLFLSFEGRIGRKWWWLAGLLVFALMVPFHLLAWTLSIGNPDGKGVDFFTYLEHAQIPSLFLAVLLFYPMLALYAKRLHDLGHSGKWAFLVMAPGLVFGITEATGMSNATKLEDSFSIIIFTIVMTVSLVATIYFGFVRGTKGDNQYGPDPIPADYDNHSRQGWMPLMFRFGGRVPRVQFWVGLTSALGIALVFFFFIGLIQSITVFPLLEGGNLDHMTEAQLEKLFANPAVSMPIGLSIALAIAALVLFTYNMLAICIKRLHDRQRSPLWLLLPLGLPVLVSLVPEIPSAFTYIGLLPALWLFVELAVLSGTVGDNKYGPDPLAPSNQNDTP